YLLGLCQSELVFFHGDAERNLKNAVELEPFNADPVYALGMLFRKQKKLKLSEKCFLRALEIDRNRSDAGKAIAEIQEQIGADKKGSFLSIFKDKQHR
ncbi:MAG: tetratricopeptide repeat protein, partial [Candidatus Aminicenantes bacterium]|nr:tetratricopeptide repeat protein [Candidatus Aminicenantes bacterium]